jgi:hypothetical protein
MQLMQNDIIFIKNDLFNNCKILKSLLIEFVFLYALFSVFKILQRMKYSIFINILYMCAAIKSVASDDSNLTHTGNIIFT